MLRELATRANTPAEVRRNAIFWLAQRRDPAIGGLLRSMYAQSADRELKEVILFAASQRRDSANASFLMNIALNEREDVELRKNALFWASQQRIIPVSRLGELYRTMPNVEMRKQVLFALTQTRDPEAVTQLIEIARTERDTQLRKDAIFWLGQSRDPRAARFLAELIGG
jgi:HEAT repeat protein